MDGVTAGINDHRMSAAIRTRKKSRDVFDIFKLTLNEGRCREMPNRICSRRRTRQADNGAGTYLDRVKLRRRISWKTRAALSRDHSDLGIGVTNVERLCAESASIGCGWLEERFPGRQAVTSDSGCCMRMIF